MPGGIGTEKENPYTFAFAGIQFLNKFNITEPDCHPELAAPLVGGVRAIQGRVHFRVFQGFTNEIAV